MQVIFARYMAMSMDFFTEKSSLRFIVYTVIFYLGYFFKTWGIKVKSHHQ